MKSFLALFCVYFFWGITYLALKVLMDDVSPLMLGASRSILAGAFLLSYFALFREIRLSLPTIKDILKSGIYFVFLSNIMVTWSLQFIASGLTALISSTIPIWVVLFSSLRNKTWPPVRSVAGILIGLAGLLVLFGDSLGGLNGWMGWVGCLGVLGGNLVWSYGVLEARKLNAEVNTFLAAGLQLTFYGWVTIPICFLVEDVHLNFNLSPVFLGAGFFVVFVDIILCYGCYLYALRHVRPEIVSLHAYVNPIIAVSAGCIFLSEPFTVETGISAICILASVALAGRNP